MAQQRPLVLLCGASGTGVSTIARKLYADDPYHIDDAQSAATDDGVIALDLEEHLCAGFKGDRRIVNSSDAIPSMAKVVMLPRDELYREWSKCCQQLMAEHARTRGANLRLLTLHLTWYDSNTSEFFSPLDIRKLDRSDCRIGHVVILIDDIFDMYCRLQEHGDLYGEPVIKNKAMLLAGLRGLDSNVALTDPSKPSSDPAQEQGRVVAARLRLEAKELALGHLMSWRRSEMISAESLARALGAKFTVLGAKHSVRALQELTKSDEISRIYLSHRISEVRRLNKRSSKLPDGLGEWSSVVEEVNQLHFDFAASSQLLINPTAIDELRFAELAQCDSSAMSAPAEKLGDSEEEPSDSTDLYRGREAAYLAARWELPKNQRAGDQDALLWIDCVKQSDDTLRQILSEHTRALTENLSYDDEVAVSVARSLEARIFEEVSFRDHIIVESTPHLCVYRPFFSPSRREHGSRVEWSGGVGPEIDHWSKKYEFRSEDNARVAFVHTTSEIEARIRWLVSQGKNAQFLDHVQSMLHRLFTNWQVLDEVIFGFFRGEVLDPSPSGLAQNPSNVVKEEPGKVLRWMRAAALLGVTEAFTRLKLTDEELPSSDTAEPISVPSSAVGLFYIEEDPDGLAKDPIDTATTLCRFFNSSTAGPDDETASVDTEDLRNRFWAKHDEIFEQVTGASLVEYISQQRGYPLDELRKADQQ